MEPMMKSLHPLASAVWPLTTGVPDPRLKLQTEVQSLRDEMGWVTSDVFFGIRLVPSSNLEHLGD